MIYLDNAATTPVEKDIAQVFYDNLINIKGNPSALHGLGISAENVLENARETIAKALNITKNEFYFTSGGTESNNFAIKGILDIKKSGTVISTEFEHPSVLECLKLYENKFNIIYLKPENGIITAESFEKALTNDTIFISIMHVNNETGAVNPIEKMAETVKKNGIKAVFHSDCVQSFTKIDFDCSKIDLASFSGHKNHAPKGIGGIYVKKGLNIKPLIHGGGQEKSLRSGTPNVAGAAAWAKSIEKLTENLDLRQKYVQKLYDEFSDELKKLGLIINEPKITSKYIMSVIFPQFLAENILQFLSQNEIYVSAGSACSAKKTSHVLKAVGIENKWQKSVLRFSFSHLNTENELKITQEVIKKAINSLIKIGK